MLSGIYSGIKKEKMTYINGRNTFALTSEAISLRSLSVIVGKDGYLVISRGRVTIPWKLI